MGQCGAKGWAKVEPQLFNLTADDSDDDEAAFFPGEAQGGDDNTWLHASDKPLVADLDNDPLPQSVAMAVDVPLAADLNVSPSPECMKQAVGGPLVAPLDFVSMPVAAA